MFVQIREKKKKIKKPSANFEAFCYSFYSGAPNIDLTTVYPQCIENTFWDYPEYF